MKYLSLDDDLYRYITACRSGVDDRILQELRTETAALGDDSRMQISEEQGSLIRLLAAAILRELRERTIRLRIVVQRSNLWSFRFGH